MTCEGRGFEYQKLGQMATWKRLQRFCESYLIFKCIKILNYVPKLFK